MNDPERVLGDSADPLTGSFTPPFLSFPVWTPVAGGKERRPNACAASNAKFLRPRALSTPRRHQT